MSITLEEKQELQRLSQQYVDQAQDQDTTGLLALLVAAAAIYRANGGSLQDFVEAAIAGWSVVNINVEEN